SLGPDGVLVDGARRVPATELAFKLLVERSPRRGNVGDHPVRERRALLVRRVRAGALRGALLDLLVELDELRAGQLGDRLVEPSREVLGRLVHERLDRPRRAI